MEHILILLLSSLAVLGCYKTSKSNEADTGTDTDADVDSDTDADADTDTDADTGMDVAAECADGLGRLDGKTGLCWQDPMSWTFVNDWRGAIDYCDKLTLGGHSDWRLPSREDFINILGGCDSDVLGGSEGSCNACAESATCTALFGADINWYSSSSPDDDPYHAWFVYFDTGTVCSLDIFHSGLVRCVRSGP